MGKNSREIKNSYLSGLVSGFFVCLIILLFLQMIGMLPKWWNTNFVKEISERARVIQQHVDKYYWKDDVSWEAMSNYATKGMMSALGDRYAAYYTEEEYSDMMKSLEGKYVGIGASIRQDANTKRKYFESVQEGKPAERAGIRAGDELLRVGGKDVTGETLPEVVNRIQEKEGEVMLGISRDENGETVQKDLSVTVETIVNQTIFSQMFEGDLGYIQIARFEKSTVGQFKTALAELEKQGQKGLIIDVRNDGGGSLDACVGVLDRILPAGTLITERSKTSGSKVYSSTDKEHFDKPMVVLINENSASASEVFAGALQDRKAAVLVGVKSFGKGIVQTIFPVGQSNGGGGIKLTTGEYLLPSGRSIHEKGLTPDVEVAYTGTTKKLGAKDDNQIRKAQEALARQIGQNP